MLLTTFNGMPIRKANGKQMVDLAKLLSRLHGIGVEALGGLQLPRYDFVNYFFPGASEHADIRHAVTVLLQSVTVQQDRIIHGDFHIANIVEENGRFTVIDWTNGQLGDHRYDLAWSFLLMKLYVSERYANVFRSAYLEDNIIPAAEMEVFEGLAVLRWILLHRSGGVPVGPGTKQTVNALIANHSILNQGIVVL